MFRFVYRAAAFVLLTALLAWLFGLLWWLVLVPATGGSHEQCDRGDCGALGGWSWDNGILLLIVYLLLGAGVAFMTLRSLLWPGRPGKSH
jgi:hypothetical protein